MNRRLGEASAFSRAYLKATLSEIRVENDVMSLKGENQAMANLIASDGVLALAALVPRFIPEWCTRRDSNS